MCFISKHFNNGITERRFLQNRHSNSTESQSRKGPLGPSPQGPLSPHAHRPHAPPQALIHVNMKTGRPEQGQTLSKSDDYGQHLSEKLRC